MNTYVDDILISPSIRTRLIVRDLLRPLRFLIELINKTRSDHYDIKPNTPNIHKNLKPFQSNHCIRLFPEVQC